MSITLIENFRAVFYGPFYAACALGAYEKEGIDVRIKTSTDPANTVNFLVSGEGEVSWGGPLRILFTLEKTPAAQPVAFCEVVGRDPFFLVGREPRPAFRLADLGGLRLATVSEVPTPWMCLQQDLRQAGIDPAGLNRLPAATMGENVEALRSGRADVIQMFQPFAAQLAGDGAGHVWYSASSRGLTSYTTLNTTRTYLEREPDIALKMCRAIVRTQKWIGAHDGAALADAIGHYFSGVPRALLAQSFDGYQSSGVWNSSPLLRADGFNWLRDAALGAGLLRRPIRYEDCVDMRFAERAAKEDPPSI